MCYQLYPVALQLPVSDLQNHIKKASFTILWLSYLKLLPKIHCFLLCSLWVTRVIFSDALSTLKTCFNATPLPDEPGKKELFRPTLVPKSVTFSVAASKIFLYRINRLGGCDRVKTKLLSKRKHCSFRPWIVFSWPSQINVVAWDRTALISSDISICPMTWRHRANPVALSTRSNMFDSISRTRLNIGASVCVSLVYFNICFINKGYLTSRDLGTSEWN